MKYVLLICLNILVGSYLLMFGVEFMGKHIAEQSKKNVEHYVLRFKHKKYQLFLFSAILTAILQSSTLVSLLCVTFVNSGLINLEMAMPIIYGSNIGTTISAQLMSISFVDYYPLLLLLAILCKILKKDTLFAFFGAIGAMFLGIKILNLSIPFINQSEFMISFFLKYRNNKVLALFFSAFITMLVHSSSATVGLTIVLFSNDLIDFETAAMMTLGDNVGTCMTSLIASKGANDGAILVALGHMLFNIIGVVVCLIFFHPFLFAVQTFSEMLMMGKEHWVANTHTLFNLLSAVVFLPLNDLFIRFLYWFYEIYKRLKIE